MTDRVRVLYTFPHRLGASRICYTAWQQVNGLAMAGAEVFVQTASLARPFSADVTVRHTLACGAVRLPFRVLGSRRMCAIHDFIVARRLKARKVAVDVVHAWPLGALRTLQAAKRAGIPTLLERPNAHTRFAYELVRQECVRLKVTLPEHHEHAYNERVLRIEEEEYRLADGLLCPSEFVRQTFLDHDFAGGKLLRHQYGYDPRVYFPSTLKRCSSEGLKIIFAGGCAPRKGLHYALEAWLQSPAHRRGTFLIAGAFVSGYADTLRSMLNHPSVQVLGHRSDLPQLMRNCDALILPSIEEGSALVTYEARGSGCVLVVSDASGAMCNHLETGLIHNAGDVRTLAEHITMLDTDRSVLEKLRAASLETVAECTWDAAGLRLLQAYRQVIAAQRDKPLAHSCEPAHTSRGI